MLSDSGQKYKGYGTKLFKNISAGTKLFQHWCCFDETTSLFRSAPTPLCGVTLLKASVFLKS
jgi:hypothetical protein